ncbi:unnamed protein product [Bursaphelenchus okinawaensis]|uniref:BED-type domain-containing protein n=1 Tax=Bursaphelenchus okinawaensis TaxID=465554 RepID=A0A811JW83_9BILA|nr:unnamed protein product [Bursaphelenchus okinawaensis]CAG9086150.1 unnamed protein product [Bursaphelenchus okinawaensis]
MDSPKAIVNPLNQKVPRNARSAFWRHFEKGMNKEGKEVVRCLYCSKEYLGRGITTSVRYHAEQEHGVREEDTVKIGSVDGENDCELVENGNFENVDKMDQPHMTAQQILGGFLNNELMQIINNDTDAPLASKLLAELATAAKLILAESPSQLSTNEETQILRAAVKCHVHLTTRNVIPSTSYAESLDDRDIRSLQHRASFNRMVEQFEQSGVTIPAKEIDKVLEVLAELNFTGFLFQKIDRSDRRRS